MIPGASKAMKDVEIEDDAFKHIEAIIHSMTPRKKQTFHNRRKEKPESQKVREES
jgi:signal recognition particle GTPase